MGLTLKMEMDAFPAGYEFAINGIGVVKNGETVEISEDQERDFVAYHRKSVPDAFEGSGTFTVEGDATVTPEDMPEVSFQRAAVQISPETAMKIADDEELTPEEGQTLVESGTDTTTSSQED
jgi:hypothetical protein